MLGLPAFGIALAYTAVTTYVPVLIERLSGPAVTGVIIGAEGLFALLVPVVVGAWSDRTSSRLGRRLPFVLAGATLACVGLLLVALTGRSLTGISVALSFFFVGYFVYHSAYYAMFPDLVSDDERGRSQGFQGTFRAVGLLLSLVAGGLLLGLWQPLPFLVGVLAVTGVTTVLLVGVRQRVGGNRDGRGTTRSNGTAGWELVRDHRDVRRWFVANSLWEAGLGALRVFVVLYLTRGLGLSMLEVAGALAMVGVAALVAAPLSGKLADRYGHRPVMLLALWAFGIGMLPPLLTTDTTYLAVIVPVALAAVVLLTLPYSVLMGLLPEREHHGTGAALFGASRGVGVLVGPLAAGFAVQVLEPVRLLTFDETRGYSAMFAVTGMLLLASVPLLHRIRT